MSPLVAIAASAPIPHKLPNEAGAPTADRSSTADSAQAPTAQPGWTNLGGRVRERWRGVAAFENGTRRATGPTCRRVCASFANARLLRRGSNKRPHEGTQRAEVG